MRPEGRVDAVRRWLSQPGQAHRLWFSPLCVWAAWIGLFAAVVLPPRGLGVALCWTQQATGLPCPGCGLLRSLSCGVRGMLPESWSYHPMGLLLLALFGLTAAQSIFPRRWRDSLNRYLEVHARWWNFLYLIFAMAFVSFGLIRALWQSIHHWIPGY